MPEDTPIPNGFSPIQRTTADQRVATFQANSNSIYNKYTPFTTNNIGPSQPFVYTKISASTLSKNLTKYDSQAFPIGSTVRDLQRIGQYSVTGNGLLYLGKQLSMQNANAFNETRIYNPLSLLKATARPGSLGLIDYPKRHLETSGGLLNFFKDALLSTIGFETKDAEKPRIEGTATGVGGVAYSTYAGSLGGARAGLLRLGTAKSAISIFESRWVTSSKKGNTDGGFLAKLGSALIGKLKSMIPSTNPMGAFGGKESDTWEYRPEYKTGAMGVYDILITDTSGFLTGKKSKEFTQFYNDTSPKANSTGNVDVKALEYHRYYPNTGATVGDTSVRYASPDKIRIEGLTSDPSFGGIGALQGTTGLKNVYADYIKTIESFDINKPIQSRRSTEAYTGLKDSKDVPYSSYKDIPGGKSVNRKYTDMVGFSVGIENANWFSKSNGLTKVEGGYTTYKSSIEDYKSEDKYNALEVLPLYRGEAPRELRQGMGDNASKSRDLIFFYFYDLINKIYVPFRATITGLSDQHSADWETVEYIGRADKLFLYKGFSRDVNFSFTVYANSAKEMLPMWNRINYLVGFTKPSKYTDMGVRTNIKDKDTEANINVARAATVEQQSVAMEDDQDTQADLTKIIEALDEASKKNIVSGKESRFIYPPMITFRLGDLFYDQPAVMQSVSVTIPDDTNWESLRSDDYSYMFGPNKSINLKNVKSRQLPMKVDVSVQLKLMEKRQALGSDAHYGNASYSTDGKETERWLL
jgi:hypothetical protein